MAPSGRGDGKGARTAIELEFEDAGDVIGAQLASLGALGRDDVGQRLGNTNGIGKLDQAALGKAALHDRLGHLPADVRSRTFHSCGGM